MCVKQLLCPSLRIILSFLLTLYLISPGQDHLFMWILKKRKTKPAKAPSGFLLLQKVTPRKKMPRCNIRGTGPHLHRVDVRGTWDPTTPNQQQCYTIALNMKHTHRPEGKWQRNTKVKSNLRSQTTSCHEMSNLAFLFLSVTSGFHHVVNTLCFNPWSYVLTFRLWQWCSSLLNSVPKLKGFFLTKEGIL